MDKEATKHIKENKRKNRQEKKVKKTFIVLIATEKLVKRIFVK
jgi:hypothetical protein